MNDCVLAVELNSSDSVFHHRARVWLASLQTDTTHQFVMSHISRGFHQWAPVWMSYESLETVVITKAAKKKVYWNLIFLNSLRHKKHICLCNKWLYSHSDGNFFASVTTSNELNAPINPCSNINSMCPIFQVWRINWSCTLTTLFFAFVLTDGLRWLPGHEETPFLPTSLFPLGHVVS